MTHDEQALAAPYVLGSLEPGERRAFEAHLASCPICREDVRSLQRVADALARSVPARTPDPAVRARVLASITGGTVRDVRAPLPRRLVREWMPLAAAMLVSVALGVYAWQLQARLSLVESRLDAAERRAVSAERATVEARNAADSARTAMAVLAAPDLTRIDLAGQPPAPEASARALWSPDRGMVFTTANLPPAPAGQVYQVWVVTAQAPVSAGLLALDASGRTTVVFNTPPGIGAPVAVAVTLEPSGGVPAPTGEKYLVGTPGPAL